jgi:hypothetical protein
MSNKKEKIIPMEVQNTYKLRVKLPDGKFTKIKKRAGDIIWSKE